MDMESEQKFFVYVDFREDDGRPFYVGKGNEGRVKDLQRNELHSRIKNKHGIIREVVFETHDEQESFEKEIQLIQELQTYVHHGKGGANLTLGGEGTSGCKREDLIKSNKKNWENPEYREKMCESSKKMWENPEHRKNISEKLCESKKKMWEDPKYKEIVSETMKKMWEDPVQREKACKSMKKAWEDPEIRERRIEKMKLSVAKLSPEQRRERVKLGWETRRLKKLQQET
jgi:hypothetical protein